MLTYSGTITLPVSTLTFLANLGNWMTKYRAAHAEDEPPLTINERARLRELERENRELRMRTEFLGKAAAFFAQEYR